MLIKRVWYVSNYNAVGARVQNENVLSYQESDSHYYDNTVVRT